MGHADPDVLAEAIARTKAENPDKEVLSCKDAMRRGIIDRYTYSEDLVSDDFDYLESDEISRFDSKVFTPPFRVGKKNQRAILDAKGMEVIIMPMNSDTQAQRYCDYLNG